MSSDECEFSGSSEDDNNKDPDYDGVNRAGIIYIHITSHFVFFFFLVIFKSFFVNVTCLSLKL